MPERSYFWPTVGTGDGPVGGYPATQVAELFEGLYPTGILWGLELSSSTGNITVGMGKAIVQGVVYFNDAPLTLTGTLPPAGQIVRGWVVVRGNASTRTARLVRLSGAANGPRPTLTQNASFPASGIWEMPVCAFDATSAGITILTGPDERQWTVPRGIIGTAQIADGAITTPKIADGAVVTADIANGAVTRPKLGFNPPEITHYCGGTTWGTTASPTLRATSAAIRILAGGADVTIPANQNLGVFDVSAPGIFASPPYVVATAIDQQTILASVVLVTASSWRLRAHETTAPVGFPRTVAVHFIAVGPA